MLCYGYCHTIYTMYVERVLRNGILWAFICFSIFFCYIALPFLYI